MFDIKIWDEIAECCNDDDVKDDVIARTHLFYPIDTKDATKKITQVGRLFEIAYTGSNSYFGICSVHVVELLTRYQDVVKSTLRTCTASTNVVIEALSFHKHAVMFAEKGKARKAIAFLGKCPDLAGKMSDECAKMITEIEELSNSSRKALTMVAETCVTDTGDKPFAQYVSLLDVYVENLKQKASDLEEEIEKARTWEEQHKEKEKSIKDRLTVGLLGPISYIGTNTEVKSVQLKLALKKEAKELNDDFVQSLGGFEESDYAENGLCTSVACFQISVKLLEKVKRMFVYGRMFWRAVEHTFKLLPSSNAAQHLADEDVFSMCKEAFLTEIKASAVGWLVLGNMCRQAALDIRDVVHGLNRSRPKLLDGSECGKLLEKLSITLLSEVAEDTEKVEDVTSDCLYEILVAKTEKETPPDDNEDVFDISPDNALSEDGGDISLDNSLSQDGGDISLDNPVT